tara:strand:+ start:606 stop:1139 length:534 start_codon:yes stop_codon:yes gene_type:complete
MAKQTVEIGTTANDGTGDQLRTAFNKLNQNFGEVYGTNFVTELMLNDDIVGAAELKVTGNGTSGQFLSSDGDGTMTWADAASGGNTASYVTTSAISPWIDKNVYVFTNTSDLTHTLPTTAVGVSFKMSLRGTGTNTLSRNGNLIMGLAENLVLDDLTASFEFFFAGGTQGWVIIGAN